METPVNYQVIFTGQLRQGFEAAAVKQALSQRLKLSPEKVEQLFANGRTVLKQTPSEEQARRIVMQLAAAGAIATVAANNGEAGPPASEAPPAAAAQEEAPEAPAKSKPLPKYSPFRRMRLFKPMLFAVAGIEVMLWLVYAGLILGLLGGVIGPSLFSTWGGQLLHSPLPGLLLQLVVFLLGTLALLIVLKPLLALRASRHRGIVIDAAQEPDLHAFIEDVCERIEAPMPSEIRLYNEAAVRTTYHQGALGFLRNQPVLSIGVPLIAWMNCSQLAALIAQSLNRYRRPNAPRATAILLATNGWLQRAVYEDDPVEAIVRRWHREGRVGDGLFGVLERFFTAGRRLVSWRLQLSRRLGRRLIHRSVAEGDKMALAFTGTDGFIRLLDQTGLLAFAGKNVLPGLEAQWQREGELPDNLVQVMVLRSRQYPVSMPQKLREMQEQQKAAIGDILPSDTQRLQRIAHQPIRGAYYCLSPAAILFRNYAKLTHTMTLRFYHHRLQLPLTPYHLKQVAAKGSLEQQLQQRLDRYFLRLYTDFMPLKLRHGIHGLGSSAEAKKQWAMAMARIRSEHERAKIARANFVATEAELVNSASREEMHLAGLGQLWHEEKLKNGELEAVHQSARDAEGEHEQAAHTLEQYLKAHAMRLGAALAVLNKGDGLPPAITALQSEAHLLVSVLERIDHVHEQLRQLGLHTVLLETLLSYRTVKKQQKLDDRIEQHAADCKHLLTAIGVALKSAPVPFANGKSKQLMGYVLQDTLTEETPQGDFDRGNDVVKRLALVQRRAIVRLVEIAEQVEKALGLAP